MRDEHMVICSPAVFELISPDAPVVPVKVELTYDSRDPYAVQASFRTGHGTAVDWVFARDLLADGLMAPEGDGDVQIWPSTPAIGPDGQIQGPLSVLNVKLSSPFGEAHFEAPAEAIANFLDRTYRIVRMGKESEVIDIDAELNGLLWQA